MRQNPILPFYMSYPYPMFYEEKDRMMKDLEYMQQLYPDEAKKILVRVVTYLERIDYDGSIIYDEYPDRIGIYRIVASILDDIKRENEDALMPLSKEKELWMQDLIKLVLFQEIFRRRYERKNGYLKF